MDISADTGTRGSGDEQIGGSETVGNGGESWSIVCLLLDVPPCYLAVQQHPLAPRRCVGGEVGKKSSTLVYERVSKKSNGCFPVPPVLLAVEYVTSVQPWEAKTQPKPPNRRPA